MGFSLDVNIPAITVFLQGLASFFSPCVLPLLPLYVGYLSAGAGSAGEDGQASYPRGKVMINILFFVLGVSFAFFLLGMGMTALGRFFHGNQMLFARIGGILVFLFGLYQLGFLGKSLLLEKERRLPLRLDGMAMSPVVALLTGFTFSFAWTPCVGPALASVLIMASSAATQAAGMALIGVYTLGFVLPFLAVGLFSASLLTFFQKHGRIVKYTVKLSGALMLVMGVLLFTGKMNDVTGYLSTLPAPGKDSAKAEGTAAPGKGSEKTDEAAALEKGSEKTDEAAASEKDSAKADGAVASGKDSEKTEENKRENDQEDGTGEQIVPAIDFTLADQYGNTHTLSDYKGKTVFLNFWATWCPPCRAEMPDIQKIYESYQESGDDSVVILGVAGPGQGRETTQEGIQAFLEENGYTYPVLMDTTGEQFLNYWVSALPTTYMIDRDGNVFGYASGQLNEEIMLSIIEQTMEGRK